LDSPATRQAGRHSHFFTIKKQGQATSIGYLISITCLRDEKITNKIEFMICCAMLRMATNKLHPMKSKRNLTRFTYDNSAFEGWRLCISRAGTTFTRYFPDRKLGGARKSLKAAETALAEVKVMLDGAKRVNGKLSPTAIKKIEKALKDAVVPVEKK